MHSKHRPGQRKALDDHIVNRKAGGFDRCNRIARQVATAEQSAPGAVQTTLQASPPSLRPGMLANNSLPPGLSTRRISSSALAGSGMVQNA